MGGCPLMWVVSGIISASSRSLNFQRVVMTLVDLRNVARTNVRMHHHAKQVDDDFLISCSNRCDTCSSL
jgi:hypothetical protein